MTLQAHELPEYQEVWIIPNTLLAFKVPPNLEELTALRKVIDGIEATIKDFPLNYG